jgi:hypothetical protein
MHISFAQGCRCCGYHPRASPGPEAVDFAPDQTLRPFRQAVAIRPMRAKVASTIDDGSGASNTIICARLLSELTLNVVNPARPGVLKVECTLKFQLLRPEFVSPAITGCNGATIETASWPTLATPLWPIRLA